MRAMTRGAVLLARRLNTAEKRSKFAKDLGVGRVTVWRWTTGKRVPPVEFAVAIQKHARIPLGAWAESPGDHRSVAVDP